MHRGIRKVFFFLDWDKWKQRNGFVGFFFFKKKVCISRKKGIIVEHTKWLCMMCLLLPKSQVTLYLDSLWQRLVLSELWAKVCTVREGHSGYSYPKRDCYWALFAIYPLNFERNGFIWRNVRILFDHGQCSLLHRTQPNWKILVCTVVKSEAQHSI